MEAIVPYLTDLFPDIVSTRRVLTRDAFGKPLTWSAWTERSARVKGGQQIEMRIGTETVTANTTAIFAGAFGLTTEYEFQLPVRFQPRTPKAIHVSQPSDENGAHHEKVFFT